MLLLRQCIRGITMSSRVVSAAAAEVNRFCKLIRLTKIDNRNSYDGLYTHVERFAKKTHICKSLSAKNAVALLAALSKLYIQTQYYDKSKRHLCFVVKLLIDNLHGDNERLRQLNINMHSNLTHKLAVTWQIHRDTSLMNLQENIAILWVDQFNPQALTNTLWAFAKTEIPAENLFNAVASSWMDRLNECCYKNLTHLSCSFATSGYKNEQFFDAIAALCIKRKNEFDPLSLSAIVWSFATVGFYNEQLFDAVASESEKLSHKFCPLSISRIVWAFATAGFRSKRLFNFIVLQSKDRFSEFNSQGLANTAWAFAIAGFPNELLFRNIALESKGRFSEFTPQELSNTAWAFAIAGFPNEQLFNNIALESKGRLNEFTPHELANTTWAFATCGMLATDLFKAVASDKNTLSECCPQELSNIAWAFAMNNVWDDSFFDALALASRRCINEFSVSQLAVFSWSCGISTGFHSDIVMESIIPALSRVVKDAIAVSEQFNAEVQNQILGSLFMFSTLRTEGKDDDFVNTLEQFSKLCSVCPLDSSSRFHREVSTTCNKLGMKHSCEVPVCKNVYVADILLNTRINGLPVIIEADGPSHFFSNDPFIPHGKTIFKRYFLEKNGFHVLSIPYWKWPLHEKEKLRFVEDLLSIK